MKPDSFVLRCILEWSRRQSVSGDMVLNVRIGGRREAGSGYYGKNGGGGGIFLGECVGVEG